MCCICWVELMRLECKLNLISFTFSKWMHLEWPQSISPTLSCHHYSLTMGCWKRLSPKAKITWPQIPQENRASVFLNPVNINLKGLFTSGSSFNQRLSVLNVTWPKRKRKKEKAYMFHTYTSFLDYNKMQAYFFFMHMTW